MTTKERPILFSGPMVRAILDGRKTQTRRIVKGLPYAALAFAEFTAADPSGFWGFGHANNPIHCIHCPHGEPGDRLWVRESFSTDIRDPLNCVIYKATPECGKYRDTGELVRSSFPDGSHPTREESARAMLPKFWKGKPSIHMPRWASRITLEIVSVRVERLNEMSVSDAIAEGVTFAKCKQASQGAVSCFRDLWESINGPESWAANPWVWVVEFRRVEQ